MTESQTGQKQYAPHLQSRGHKKGHYFQKKNESEFPVDMHSDILSPL